MRSIFSKLAIVAILSFLASGLTGAAASSLMVGGTGSATEMLRQVGDLFAKSSATAVNVTPNLGSGGAIRALADGKLDIAVAARPLTPDEAAKGLSQVLVLRTAYVLATSHAGREGFKASDFPKIFAEKKPVWHDGAPLLIILRPKSETDTTLLGDLFPGMAAAIEAARLRPEVPTAATDQDNAAMAERMPGALIGISLAQLTSEKRGLNAVALDGVAPTLANFESGAYRYEKKLYFIVRTNSALEAGKFVAYLRSPEGVLALRGNDTLVGAN